MIKIKEHNYEKPLYTCTSCNKDYTSRDTVEYVMVGEIRKPHCIVCHDILDYYKKK